MSLSLASASADDSFNLALASRSSRLRQCVDSRDSLARSFASSRERNVRPSSRWRPFTSFVRMSISAYFLVAAEASYEGRSKK